MSVDRFMGQYRFLSNFHPCYPHILGPGDLLYPTVEHAYQASKSSEEVDWRWVLRSRTASDAKHVGRKLKIIEGWDNLRIPVMRKLLRRKFAPGSPFARQIMDVQGEIKEGNYWHDTFWGVDSLTGEGFNHLGRLLMEVRDDLIAKAIWEN